MSKQGKDGKKFLSILVFHKQFLGLNNMSIFNFVAFSLSGKLFSLSDHFVRLFGFSAQSFSFSLFLVPDHLSDLLISYIFITFCLVLLIYFTFLLLFLFAFAKFIIH